MHLKWDIFCNVVDNYGDIGVSWRLARVLVHAQGQTVRLWVDDLAAFKRIWPAVDVAAAVQTREGVEIRAWHTSFADVEPADVVVDAFGCALPGRYLAAMATRTPQPVWINLEYLSAEPWVATHQALPSPHPRLPLTRYFFFPGFMPETGGVLVEPGLERARTAFRTTELEAHRRVLTGSEAPADALYVSMFAYENSALFPLLEAWAADDRPLVCLVPEGRVVPQLANWFGVPSMEAGETVSRNALRVTVVPFSDQDGYDRLLWACDLNFVRGEDSCIRAQWAARPMVWQAYPQAERAHWAKVNALLDLYAAGLTPGAAAAVRGLWQGWNGMAGGDDLAGAWDAWRTHCAEIDRHADAWCQRLAAAGNLAAKLAEFARSKVK